MPFFALIWLGLLLLIPAPALAQSAASPSPDPALSEPCVSGPDCGVLDDEEAIISDLDPEDPLDPATERDTLIFLTDPDSRGDLSSVPLPPDVAPAPSVVPLPPVASPAPASGDQKNPALRGAAPALSLYPEEVQSSLPKERVPDLVADPGDVACLNALRRNNDAGNRLGWDLDGEAAGEGIQADAEGRLIRLTLPDVGLTGLLDLAGAKRLTEIKSTGNQLTGLRLSGLNRLRQVSLTGGGLTRLPRGDLSGLASLTNLDLANNRIEIFENGALAGAARLERLRLTGNQLAFLDRGCFTGLERLAELNLDGNRIKEIRWGALAPLTGLVTLHLGGNRLQEIGAGLFPGLVNLEILHLENNRITRLAREALTGLTALKYLDLSNNRLAGLPSGALSGLENLSEIDLTGNCLPLGALKTVVDEAPEGAHLYLRGQKDVYFGLRVQLMPKADSFIIPPSDAFINGVPSQGRILGDDPAGATYAPAEAEGGAGRLTFHRPGVYTLVLTNSELSDDPDLSATTGRFLVVDRHPTVEEATKKLGSRDLAAGLVGALASRGFVEAPSGHPKRVSALKALFSPPPGPEWGNAPSTNKVGE